MIDPSLAALTSIPAALAVIVVTGMFLRFVSAERAKDRELWGNHLSRISATLERLVEITTLASARAQDAADAARQFREGR